MRSDKKFKLNAVCVGLAAAGMSITLAVEAAPVSWVGSTGYWVLPVIGALPGCPAQAPM